MRVLPFLNKLVAGLNNTGSWIKKNSDFVIALSIAITVALIPAVVTLTKKLALLAVTILKSPIGRAAVMIFAVAYAFVKAYNASEDFRKALANVAKYALTAAGYIVGALESIIKPLSNSIGLGLKLRKVWQNFRNDTAGAAETAKEIAAWEAEHAKIGNWTKAIEEAKKSVDNFAEKKISLNWDFKVPQIPGFENGIGEGGGDIAGEISEIADALINARQRVIDFNKELNETAKVLKVTWSNVVGKDIKKAIEEGLLNPVDALIVQAQKSVDAYQSASNSYTKSLNELTKAQNAYTEAVGSGNKEAITSTESALRFAENTVNQFTDNMQKSLDEIAQFQEEAINAVIDSYNKISELENNRTEVLAKAKEDRYELEKEYNKDVAQLNADYNKNVLNAQKEAAKRSAEIVKQSVDQLRSVYKSATYQSLGDIFSNLTYQGRYLAGGTTDKILSALGLKADKAKTLADDAATLAGLGFSQTFIEEVVSQGTDVGHQLAQTIINSTPESIRQMQKYWDALQNQSSHGVDLVASKLNAGVVLATEELTAQLAQVGIDLNEQLAQYNVELTGALASSFDTYANSLSKINSATAAQIISIDAQISSLKAKILQLNQAQAQVQTLSSPGTVQAPIILAPKTETYEVEEANLEVSKALAAAAAAETASLEIEKYLADLDATLANLRQQAPTVTIYTDTNASPQLIADEVAWAIRTSGDMKYGLNQKNRWML
jgi:hypothetical protein